MSASLPDQVAIRFSRWKHIGLAVLALAAVPVLAYAIVLFHRIGLWHWQILVTVEMAIMGALFFFFIARAFDRKPGLIVDRQGLTDRTDYMGARHVDWTAVRGIRTARILMYRHLVVDLHDPRQIANRSNAVQRLLRAPRAWLVGSPLDLISFPLDSSFGGMAGVVGAFFDQAKAAGKAPLSSGTSDV
jgi:hypothetical protein